MLATVDDAAGGWDGDANLFGLDPGADQSLADDVGQTLLERQQPAHQCVRLGQLSGHLEQGILPAASVGSSRRLAGLDLLAGGFQVAPELLADGSLAYAQGAGSGGLCAMLRDSGSYLDLPDGR